MSFRFFVMITAFLTSFSASANDSLGVDIEAGASATASSSGVGGGFEVRTKDYFRQTEFNGSIGVVRNQVVGSGDLMISGGTALPYFPIAVQIDGDNTPLSGGAGVGIGAMEHTRDGRSYIIVQPLGFRLSDEDKNDYGAFGPGAILGIEKKILPFLEVGAKLKGQLLLITEDERVKNGTGGRIDLKGYAKLINSLGYVQLATGVEHESGKVIRYLVPKNPEAGTTPEKSFSSTNVSATVSAGFVF